MATVMNKATGVVDDKSFDVQNRVVSAEPNGTTVPQYSGELVLDTTNNCLWKAMNTDSSSWIALTPPN